MLGSGLCVVESTWTCDKQVPIKSCCSLWCGPGVAPDVTLGVAPDVVPGVAPDVTLGVAPDVVPGVAPDVTLGVAPDVVPGVAPDVVPGVAPGVELM